MKKHSFPLFVYAFFLTIAISIKSEAQYVSPFAYENGKYRVKSSSEMTREASEIERYRKSNPAPKVYYEKKNKFTINVPKPSVTDYAARNRARLMSIISQYNLLYPGDSIPFHILKEVAEMTEIKDESLFRMQQFLLNSINDYYIDEADYNLTYRYLFYYNMQSDPGEAEPGKLPAIRPDDYHHLWIRSISRIPFEIRPIGWLEFLFWNHLVYESDKACTGEIKKYLQWVEVSHDYTELFSFKTLQPDSYNSKNYFNPYFEKVPDYLQLFLKGKLTWAEQGLFGSLRKTSFESYLEDIKEEVGVAEFSREQQKKREKLDADNSFKVAKYTDSVRNKVLKTIQVKEQLLKDHLKQQEEQELKYAQKFPEWQQAYVMYAEAFKNHRFDIYAFFDPGPLEYLERCFERTTYQPGRYLAADILMASLQKDRESIKKILSLWPPEKVAAKWTHPDSLAAFNNTLQVISEASMYEEQYILLLRKAGLFDQVVKYYRTEKFPFGACKTANLEALCITGDFKGAENILELFRKLRNMTNTRGTAMDFIMMRGIYNFYRKNFKEAWVDLNDKIIPNNEATDPDRNWAGLEYYVPTIFTTEYTYLYFCCADKLNKNDFIDYLSKVSLPSSAPDQIREKFGKLFKKQEVIR